MTRRPGLVEQLQREVDIPISNVIGRVHEVEADLLVVEDGVVVAPW